MPRYTIFMIVHLCKLDDISITTVIASALPCTRRPSFQYTRSERKKHELKMWLNPWCPRIYKVRKSVSVVYFDQLSVAACTLTLVEIMYRGPKLESEPLYPYTCIISTQL